MREGYSPRVMITCPGCGIELNSQAADDVGVRWVKLAVTSGDLDQMHRWQVNCDCGAEVLVTVPHQAMALGVPPRVRVEHLNPKPKPRFRKYPDPYGPPPQPIGRDELEARMEAIARRRKLLESR